MLDIYIGTYSREKKLARCITSILAQEFKDWRLIVKYDMHKEFVFKIWNRELKNMQHDWAILICDDVEFLPGCFTEIVRIINTLPDSNYLIGYNQTNIPPDEEGFSQSAQVVIGRKFVERFPDKNPFCPDYRSFGADAELGHFARITNSFIWAENAKMIHHHPAHCPKEMDETHKIVRAGNMVQIDNDKYQQRVIQRGWTWGKDFNRLCL